MIAHKQELIAKKCMKNILKVLYSSNLVVKLLTIVEM